MKTLLLLLGFTICGLLLMDTITALASDLADLREEMNDIHSTEAEQAKVDRSALHSMIATAYCLDGTTATGTHTRRGIAASKREWFGKTVRVYWNDCGSPGALVGEYVVEDTGGRAIRNGSVIDIWMPTADECFQFGRRLVLVEVVD